MSVVCRLDRVFAWCHYFCLGPRIYYFVVFLTIYLFMSGTYVDSVPRVERDTVANSPPLFYHSTQLSCRQNNQCLLEGLRAKGYVCVPGWSLSSRLCAHFLPFVLGTDKQGVGRIASLLCACGGSGSGCPPRIYLRRLCAVSLQFCVSIRTSAPCERLSSVCNDAAPDWIHS